MCWQGNALYAAVVSCSSSIHSTAAMSSGGIFGATLAVVRSLCCAVLSKDSGSEWRNVLPVPSSSGDALYFSSVLASLGQVRRLKDLSANDGKRGIPFRNGFMA